MLATVRTLKPTIIELILIHRYPLLISFLAYNGLAVAKIIKSPKFFGLITNLQYPKISYFISTSKNFMTAQNCGSRHGCYTFGQGKICSIS